MQVKPFKYLTLLYVIKENKILLAMKKRGFGAGKYNGFGGKVNQQGETVYQAAIRETFEEGCITPTDAKFVGYIKQDYDCEKETLIIHVFRATQYQGEVAETEEMKPEWFDLKQIPYEKMWIDDIYWFPYLLNSWSFRGYCEFQGHEKLLKIEFETVSDDELMTIKSDIAFH